ncbi:MAG: type II secretion system protein GspG [bacterium]
MGTFLLQTTIVLATATIAINGLTVNASDILADATTAVNGANIHQLSTALEMYSLDHDGYPQTNDGTTMINVLFDQGYIKSKPANSAVFAYTSKSNGNDYTLNIK